MSVVNTRALELVPVAKSGDLGPSRQVEPVDIADASGWLRPDHRIPGLVSSRRRVIPAGQGRHCLSEGCPAAGGYQPVRERAEGLKPFGCNQGRFVVDDELPELSEHASPFPAIVIRGDGRVTRGGRPVPCRPGTSTAVHSSRSPRFVSGLADGSSTRPPFLPNGRSCARGFATCSSGFLFPTRP